MRNCMKCNYKFTYLDALKASINFKGYLRCQKCNSAYKAENNLCRGIYYISIFFLDMWLYDYMSIENFILKYIIYAIIVVLAILSFDIFFFKWIEYEKVENEK